MSKEKRTKNIYVFFLHSILLLAYFSGYAQEETPLSETKTYSLKSNPNQTFPIDSGIQNIESYHFMSTPTWDNRHLGNIGLMHYALDLNHSFNPSFRDGMIYFDRYKHHISSIRYYHINKPLSEIYYFIGSQKEHVFGAQHAQNVKNRFEYGVDFWRIASEGTYQNQQTRNGSFSLYGIFHSKNDRYQLATDMAFSRIRIQENGGIQEDFIHNDTIEKVNSLFYTPYLTDANTEHKNFSVHITNQYGFGTEYTDSINDSTTVKRFAAKYQIEHRIGTNKNRYSFLDASPDSSFYKDFFQSEDSVWFDFSYHNIPHAVAFKYTGLQGSSSSEYRNIQALLYIQHNNIELRQNRREWTTNNVHIGGSVSSNKQSNSKWQYALNGYYYFTDYNKHDAGIRLDLGFSLKKAGQLYTQFQFQQIEPTWMHQHYVSSSMQWNPNFSKENWNLASIQYHWPAQNLLFGTEYSSIKNYTYFGPLSTPTQISSFIHYVKAYIQKDFSWKILHINTFIGYQYVSHSQAFYMPNWYFKNSTYIEGKIFKKNMLAQLGIDIQYNSPFRVPAWNPVIGQFHVQESASFSFPPVVDFFINFKVKTLRVFIKANYINEGIRKKGYYAAFNYPARGRTFAGGLKWRFLE